MLAHAGAADESLSVVLLFAGLWAGWVGWSRLKGRGFSRLPTGGAVALVTTGVALGVSAAFVPRLFFPPSDPGATPTTSGPRPSSTASVRFTAPTDGQMVRDDTLDVTIDLQGGRVIEAASTDLTADTGHIHLILDDRLISMTFGVVQAVDLRTLAPGAHTLEAEFVAADHGPFAPRVTTIVRFRTGSSP